MPAILDINQIGKREDLADIIWLAAVTETPLTSSLRKGKKLERVDLVQYQVKKLGNRKPGGVTDGQDIQAFDADPPRALLYARGEVYRRAPMVGFIAAENVVAGVTSEYADSITDQMIEHKKDIEAELFSLQDSAPDDGQDGSKTRGLAVWINDGTTPGFSATELPVPSAFRTPTAQIYSGSIAATDVTTGLTEAVFTAMAQNRWDNFGTSTELMLFCSVTIKNKVGLFSRYLPNATGATPVVRSMTAEFDGGTYYGPTVDVFKTDWGTFTLMPVPSEYLPTTYTAYGLDMNHPELRSRYMMREKPLPDLGGGPRELVESVVALIIGDPRVHIKIAGSA